MATFLCDIVWCWKCWLQYIKRFCAVLGSYPWQFAWIPQKKLHFLLLLNKVLHRDSSLSYGHLPPPIYRHPLSPIWFQSGYSDTYPILTWVIWAIVPTSIEHIHHPQFYCELVIWQFLHKSMINILLDRCLVMVLQA